MAYTGVASGQARGGVPAVLSALDSLAAWQGVAPTVMAQRLLGMTEERRTALREEYAAQAEGPLHAP